MKQNVMKRILLTATTVLAVIVASAQSDVFTFMPVPRNLDDSQVDKSLVRDHFMGDEIAIKMQILKDSYTWMQPSDPTKPVPTQIVEKPNIYQNVRKIEKFYKKQIKDGSLTEEVAKDEFDKILNIAIYIRHQETEAFEEKLKSLKSEEEMVSLFTKSVVLSSAY